MKVKTILKNKTKNEIYENVFPALKIKNKITYKENDILVTVLISKSDIIIKRKSKDYLIELSFELNKETSGTYNISNLGIIPLKIKTNKLIIKDNKIEIEYTLELEEENEFYIEIEEIK